MCMGCARVRPISFHEMFRQHIRVHLVQFLCLHIFRCKHALRREYSATRSACTCGDTCCRRASAAAKLYLGRSAKTHPPSGLRAHTQWSGVCVCVCQWCRVHGQMLHSLSLLGATRKVFTPGIVLFRIRNDGRRRRTTDHAPPSPPSSRMKLPLQLSGKYVALSRVRACVAPILCNTHPRTHKRTTFARGMCCIAYFVLACVRAQRNTAHPCTLHIDDWLRTRSKMQ